MSIDSTTHGTPVFDGSLAVATIYPPIGANPAYWWQIHHTGQRGSAGTREAALAAVRSVVQAKMKKDRARPPLTQVPAGDTTGTVRETDSFERELVILRLRGSGPGRVPQP